MEAEPLSARRAVAFPIEPWVVGKDLDTGADDERHEEKVQEMLHPQPCRKTSVDGQSGRRDARVPHKEILYRRQLTQSLCYGDANDAKHKTEW
jgi:hypothetical protein